MKSLGYYLIIFAVLLYFERVGQKEANAVGKKTNMLDNVMRGIDVTIATVFSSTSNAVKNVSSTLLSPGWADEKPTNEEMVDYVGANAFTYPLKRHRGLFHHNIANN